MSTLRDVDSGDLLRFAQRYADLGWAVWPQVKSLLCGDFSHDNINPAAVRLIRKELGGMNAELDEAIAEYEAAERVEVTQ